VTGADGRVHNSPREDRHDADGDRGSADKGDKTLADLVAAGKAKPGSLVATTAGRDQGELKR
jgi:hypothetical protein